jgi:CHAD domain-containing protein
MEKRVEAMKWKASISTAENAARKLPQLATEYFEAGREAVAGRKSPRELHRFRVRTKRFRYALEFFRPVYGPELEGLLQDLQQLQKLLGKISDLYTIRELLKEEDGGHKKALHKEGLKKIRDFKAYWKTTFDADGQEESWTSALRTPVISSSGPTQSHFEQQEFA